VTRDLLFEIGTEELPPRTLEQLSTSLADGMVAGLEALTIEHGSVQRFATPRRLAVLIRGVTEQAADRPFERRGPPIANAFDASGAPTQAAVAFAKSCGVEIAALERLTTEKGAWLVHRGTQRGAATASVLGEIIAKAIAALPIARRMRWGAGTAEFVRPVHSVVLLFGGDVVPIEVLGLESGRITHGHRFHAPRPITLRSPASYAKRLERAYVIADFAERRSRLNAGVAAAAAEAGGTALIDEALLDEVTALVEWPVPIVGHFERRFLELPREVVIATVKDHQRYFPIEGHDGHLTGGFVTVSNIESKDPGRVRQGNERVVRPRLADAAFFWEQDRKVPLEAHAARLAQVTFQTRLGTYADKTRRVRALALEIGERIGNRGGERLGAHPAALAQAAELARADLMTQMVGEFPELQGTMGRYYAEAEGLPEEVARAIEEQYRPRFAGDALPETATGRALALADKIDTLVGIFAIEERPTGAKDPFGLRRAALGILRILIEGGIDLDLESLLEHAAAAQPVVRAGVVDEVVAFLGERLRGLLLERQAGTTVEMVEAVLAGRPRSPLDALARLTALREFLSIPEAPVLTALNKRIGNILKKAPGSGAALKTAPESGAARPAREELTQEVERHLASELERLAGTQGPLIEKRRYAQALREVSALAAPIDAFFNGVMVMDEDPKRREHRLGLLREAQRLLGGVADLSRLPG
jgi:glycyl-tRNA synthetase beta chain